MSATFTVDGTSGAGGTLTAAVLDNIRSFEWDVENSKLKLTDSNGKVTNIVCGDVATITVGVANFKVTSVTVAN